MEHTDSDLIGKKRQIKSKERVSNHGEVFTADREVNAMLDLVKQETERIDSRFLEPACGTGNFLAKILERKLAVVKQNFNSCRSVYELNAIIAVGSIYGIELLEDNVDECHHRLFGIFMREYESNYSAGDSFEEYSKSVKYVLRRNILWGDALTLLAPDGSKPIVFSEWSAVGNKIQRRDFTLDNLLKNQPIQEPNLFSDLGEEAFIPTPIKEFELKHYLKLYEHESIQS